MPRVRLTARGWLAAALFGAGVCALPALAAPGAPKMATPPATGARPADAEARRREEVDALQRQDAADALKRHYNIDVDWRQTSLDRLIDIRVRAAKAADLQQRLGVSVDWQRYSWIELEALRRTLLSFEDYRNADTPNATAPSMPTRAATQELSPHADDGLVRPTFKERPVVRSRRSTDPDGVIRPTFTGRVAAPVDARDPDGVIRPTFVVRPRWSAAAVDPDGLIAPTFAPLRRFAAIGDADDLIDPTPTRTTEVRSVVPARW
jgi:hypothetical protein